MDRDPLIVLTRLARLARIAPALRRLDPNWDRLTVLVRRAGEQIAPALRRLDPALVAVADLGRAVRRYPGRTAALVLGLGGVPLLALATWALWTVASVDLARLHQDAAVLYGAGEAIRPGVSIEAADLAGTLRRLGYEETTTAPSAPGRFRRTEGQWHIFLRARDDPGATRPPLQARLGLDGTRVVDVSTADGGRMSEIELEPEVLSGLGMGGLHQPVVLSAVPAHLVAAVLAAEDRRFFQHDGVDGRAILRAVWANVRYGRVRQGGSTLTQQLVKNTILTPRRTWDRKVLEASLALALEWRYDKRAILEAYLNDVYLGQQGGLPVYGVGAAARSFFGKDVERLTLGEAALLAGIIRAPSTYSPLQHPDRARERRNLVLREMRRLAMIDEPRYAKALRERMVARSDPAVRLIGPYFADYTRAEVEGLPGQGDMPASGLRIYTTLNPVLQRAAEAAVARGLDRLEGAWQHLRRRDPAARLQAALVALDPVTGEIRALVGGRDYAASQFNRAALARRQPGSAFKPFVYLAGLAFGPRGEPPHFTAVSHLEDRPRTIQVGQTTWTPRNYENRFEGTVTVRRALEQSLNAATIWMAEAVGYDQVVETARRAGFTSRLAPVPAVALGSFEVTPLELAAAYVPFANGGDRVPPTAVRAVLDRAGGVTEPPGRRRTPAMRPEEAFLVTSLLEGVVERGTGAAARLLGVEGPVAGKTGTTNEGRDAWFVGYTGRLVTLVWVGFDHKEVLRLSGAQAALPIWADFMRIAMTVEPAGGFVTPPSVVFRDVDPETGKLASSGCPATVHEAFLASTEPRELCPEHGPVDLFQSIFRRFFVPSGTPGALRIR
jgi:penicillin-binding protein 1B